MHIHFAPTGINAECKTIEMHHEHLKEALPGDNVGFNVKGVAASEIKRGYVASNQDDDPAQDTEWFRA